MIPALHAEWTRLRTEPAVHLLLPSIVAVTVLVSLLAVAACPRNECGLDPAALTLAGVRLGQALVVLLAVSVLGGSLRTTFTAVPRRLVVLGVKALVVSASTLVTGGLAVLGCLAAGRAILPVGGPGLRAAAGSVLYLILIGLLALGVVAALRDPATSAAVVLVLVLLYAPPLIATTVTDPDTQRALRRFAPMPSGLSVQATTGPPITPWAGLGVLAAWSVASLVIGAVVLHRRDA
ncbi:ABC transporter permease [Catenuloplanes sp. NPDC051500]|uniref:ABC transporter permease n=1 Tax=Catenuloplanes sp. NPDC051500 TaxID=3363959 RepID=UPI0037BDDC5D